MDQYDIVNSLIDIYNISRDERADDRILVLVSDIITEFELEGFDGWRLNPEARENIVKYFD